jgi:hypothetical protein
LNQSCTAEAKLGGTSFNSKDAASKNLRAGVDLPTLGALLRHTSIQMTMRYVHPAEEHKREAAGRNENFKAVSAMKLAEEVTAYLQFPLQ